MIMRAPAIEVIRKGDPVLITGVGRVRPAQPGGIWTGYALNDANPGQMVEVEEPTQLENKD